MVTYPASNGMGCGNKHHPAVVVDGPHANGKVTLAPVSHNHDPFGIHQPTIDMKHFLTSDHKLTGFVSLLAVQAKAKFTSDTHHADLTHSALNDLKAHMGTNTGWKVGDSVASEHSGPAPPGAESSAGEPGSKHHSGQGSNHGQSTSQHASQSHPPSHTGHKASSQGTTGNPSSILSKVKAGVSWKSKKSKKS
ncbi:hypothetical protein D9619_012592 [Psilocybe cf. subviscida]|uniref:Uncharacterized protein n=1 Tax=Psilocybe cf. subviscida TaxID=2480587 RepID=A0A8H5EZ51_9AGAR|nr:hypothetical protein D9619_012592 [Psilocybe cf. subviscida]